MKTEMNQANKVKKRNKWLFRAVGIGTVGAVAVAQPVSAMHIMEGFLSPKYCIAWGILCLPFFIAGFYAIKRTIEQDRKRLLLLAMCGAFAFILSALKLPSVSGSCSHPTGVGLGAILFGPTVMAVLGTIVLLFQALLLAHGGLTTLGANSFSMAIAGPILSWLLFKGLTKLKANRYVVVFIAAFAGDLFTYCVTSVQLGLDHPVGGVLHATIQFLGIFAVTQVPIAIAEGIVTVFVYDFLWKYNQEVLRDLETVTKQARV